MQMSGRTHTSSIRNLAGRMVIGLEKRVRLRVAIGMCVIVLLANLDALVDAVMHPELAYFDNGHLVVGGVTSIVAAVLFGLLSIYVGNLKRAMSQIKTLEGLLPICSSCHKIRSKENEWHSLEKYISERTEATFTHSICPDCAKTLYPEMFRNNP